MTKVNQKIKFESTYTEGRWFFGRVYAIVDSYALVKDENGKMYPQYVAIKRLVNVK